MAFIAMAAKPVDIALGAIGGGFSITGRNIKLNAKGIRHLDKFAIIPVGVAGIV